MMTRKEMRHRARKGFSDMCGCASCRRGEKQNKRRRNRLFRRRIRQIDRHNW